MSPLVETDVNDENIDYKNTPQSEWPTEIFENENTPTLDLLDDTLDDHEDQTNPSNPSATIVDLSINQLPYEDVANNFLPDIFIPLGIDYSNSGKETPFTPKLTNQETQLNIILSKMYSLYDAKQIKTSPSQVILNKIEEGLLRKNLDSNQIHSMVLLYVHSIHFPVSQSGFYYTPNTEVIKTEYERCIADISSTHIGRSMIAETPFSNEYWRGLKISINQSKKEQALVLP